MQEPLRTSAPLLLTVPEAAKMLAIGRSSVYKLIAGGQIQPVRLVGRSVRIRRSDVERLVAEQ